MSRQAAATFLGHVRSNPALRTKLGSNPTPELYLEEASQAGLQFTSEELKGVAMAEQFLQKSIDDPVLYGRLRSADESSMVELARGLGFECGSEDIEAVLSPSAAGELSDSELQTVAGGFSVAKVPAPPAPYVPVPYPNGW